MLLTTDDELKREGSSILVNIRVVITFKIKINRFRRLLQLVLWRRLDLDTEQLMTASVLAIWILGPFLGLMIFLFIFRIVLTWYPQVDLNRLPFNLVAWPTEPFLVPVRKLVPPLGGVDISPIIWVGIFSLLREMLLGQQGLLTMMH